MKKANRLLGYALSVCIVYIWQKWFGRRFNRKVGIHCRFFPSCSEYAVLALRKYGLFKGAAVSWNRLKRCTRDNFGRCLDMP